MSDPDDQGRLSELQSDIRAITIELHNIESEMTNIENKLTFSLIVKINNIIEINILIK